MSKICEELHKLLNSMKRFKFPFNENEIPLNGIYALFEKGEKGHELDRIVRIGTHTGKNQLRSRLKQHFINENKDRSIFRKNIGRAILNKERDSFINSWNKDLTTKKAKEKFSQSTDFNKQREIEKKVSEFIQKNFSFVVFRVDEKDKRLNLESKIISTISSCKECNPSNDWLGLFSPKEKIVNNGLWLVNEIGKEPLNEEELSELKKILD